MTKILNTELVTILSHLLSRVILFCSSLYKLVEVGSYFIDVVPQTQECPDSYFQRILPMIRVLIRHSSHVFSQLPAVNQSLMPKNRKEQLLERLPERFNRMDFIELAKGLSINERTAYTYISIFCDKVLIVREQQGVYSKAENG